MITGNMLELAVAAVRSETTEQFNKTFEPRSSDFQDGSEAEGWWINGDGSIRNQVVGSSGIYLIEYDQDGELVRDSRPWPMKV